MESGEMPRQESPGADRLAPVESDAEGHEVQAGLRVRFTLHQAVQDRDHQLAGGADHGAVQMPAPDPALVVADADVEVAVGPAVLGGESAVQADDFKVSLKFVGPVLLGDRGKDAGRHLVHGAQAVDGGQGDMLPAGQVQQAVYNFLPPVQADNERMFKFLVFHLNFLLCFWEKSCQKWLA